MVAIFKLPRLADYHVHLRQGDLCRAVAPYTASVCEHALVMPNTDPPITTPARLMAYRVEVNEAAPSSCLFHFTFMLTQVTTPDDVAGFVRASASGAKLYPQGVTTHSDHGIPSEWLGGLSSRIDLLSSRGDYQDRFMASLQALEQADLVLHIHPEMPGSFVMDSENEFLPFLTKLRLLFPHLRLQIEHITTAALADWVKQQPLDLVAGTITPQHLAYHLGHLFEGGLRPWRYCKPVYKLPADREALWKATQDEHFFLGSDSAPHSPGRKLSSCGCAGVWSAPVLPQILTHLFEQAGLLDFLPAFVRYRAERFHLLPASDSAPLVLNNAPYHVPTAIAGMEPLLTGETLNWTLEEPHGYACR